MLLLREEEQRERERLEVLNDASEEERGGLQGRFNIERR